LAQDCLAGNCLPSQAFYFAYFPFVMAHFNQVNVHAQRLVVEALGRRNFQEGRNVLCHSASELSAGSGLLISTHDRLSEILAHKQCKVTSVFPNISQIRRLCRKFQDEFSFELVIACPFPCDPFEVAMDVLGKFPTDFCYVQQVEFLVELPPGTYRKKASSAAYTVIVANLKSENFKILWKRQA